MKKNPLLILSAALVLLVAAYFGISAIVSNANQKKSQEKTESLTALSLEDVTEISYTDGKEALTFVKSDGGWSCSEYPDYPIRQSYLNLLESNLENIVTSRILDEHGELSEYGLENPSATVNFTAADGSTHTLSLGSDITSSTYYAALSGDERVFVMDGTSYIHTYVTYGIMDYIQYSPMPSIIADDVTAINLVHGDDVLEFTRTDLPEADEAGNTYYWDCIKNGESTEATFEHIETALNDLTTLSDLGCAAYAPDSEQLAAYGLDEPYAVLTVYYTHGGEEKSFTMTFGGTTPSGNTATIFGDEKAVSEYKTETVKEMVSLLYSVS